MTAHPEGLADKEEARHPFTVVCPSGAPDDGLGVELFEPVNKREAVHESHGDQRTYWQDVRVRLLRNRLAVASLAVLALILLYAIVVPISSPYAFDAVNPSAADLPMKVPGFERLGIFDGSENGKDAYAAAGIPQEYHLFGTDSLGRDIWTRAAVGCRISLLIAAVAVGIDICIGIVYGLISGYFGGRVDFVMQRVIEVVSGIPQLVILTLLLLVLKPGLGTIILAIMITGWINMSRIVRAQTLKLKSADYVLASRTLGASPLAIVRDDILPNTLGQIIVTFMFSIPTAIFTEAFLAFIGLGVPAPLASLGTMINDGYQSAMAHPNEVVLPVLVLALLMLCFNLLADGLRDAVDPRMASM